MLANEYSQETKTWVRIPAVDVMDDASQRKVAYRQQKTRWLLNCVEDKETGSGS